MVAKLDGLKIARSRGGKCLSKSYKNSRCYMKWECSVKHRWLADLNNIKYGKTWCPTCYKQSRSEKCRAKDGLIIAKQIAKSHGGKCLSSKYINNYTKMRWECSKKHRWELHYIV